MDDNTEDEIKFHHNVLELITKRFIKKKYYTWAELVLISLNPFTNLESDTEEREVLMKRLKEVRMGKIEPHIYSVAKRACSYIVSNQKDQIIVITGDSGSGKTFSTQEALRFLSDDDTPLGKIKYSLVILNAFGNAATECHSNSSRFGKLILLGYDGYSNKILDASFHTYLLEKTRVSSPSVKNFHIFYQVVAACVVSSDYDLHLKHDVQFRILPGKTLTSDMRSFVNLLEAFKHLQFKHSTVNGILTVISAILHLGNIAFSISDSGKCCVDILHPESYFALHYASTLLGLEPETLKVLLTHTVIAPDPASSRCGRRRSIYQVPVPTLADAFTRRDALIKTLYLMLFDWIVSKINLNFSNCNSKSVYKLGLLDIYGFEMFSRNSLEQLCINYANERLHSFFVHDFLMQKRTTLINEGLTFDSGPKLDQYFKDTSTRISKIDAPFSVFGVINEGSLLNRHTSGKELCQRMSTLPKNKFVTVLVNEQMFVISHFAGAVKYDARHMIEKNSDKIPNEVADLLMASKNSFLAKLISHGGTSTTSGNTVLSKFKMSFDSLLKQLKASQVHYVRCIKPNIQMKPGFIDKNFLEKQLHSSGILEAVKLCGHCFPIQFTIGEFLGHFYRLIGNYKMEQYGYCLEEFQRAVILRWISDVGLRYQVGNKYVFLSEDEYASLEAKREFLRQHCARVIQRRWRIHWHKKILKTCVSKNREVSEEGESSSHILNKFQDGNCITPADMSTSNTEKNVCLSQGDTSKSVDNEDNLIDHAVSENIVCIRGDRGDNKSSKSKLTGVKQWREGKLDLMLEWLDKIPYEPSMPYKPDSLCQLSYGKSRPRIGPISSYPQMFPLSISSICCKSDTKSSLSTSIVVFHELSQKIQKNHSLQSELYSIANKSYPATAKKLFSYHFLKKIVISEKRKGNEVFFIGNGVVSRRSLAKIPMWFHTRKTCLSYSYVVPFSELPKGLEDAFC